MSSTDDARELNRLGMEKLRRGMASERKTATERHLAAARLPAEPKPEWIEAMARSVLHNKGRHDWDDIAEWYKEARRDDMRAAYTALREAMEQTP